MKLKMSLLASLMLVLFASCKDTADPYMTLASKTLEVVSDGGEYTVEVASNVKYNVLNDCDWVEIKGVDQIGDKCVFTLGVEPNAKEAKREGTIRFIGESVTPLKLYIKQGGVLPKGVSPESAEVAASATESSFKVYAQGDWTASCADQNVVVTPASGSGETDVKVTFPANGGTTPRTIAVKVNVSGDKEYTHTITQKGFVGVFADWDILGDKTKYDTTWAEDAQQTVFPGTNGKYIPSTIGNGKIEYWACDRAAAGITIGDFSCQRRVGAKGDTYVSGVVPGDMWLVTADVNGGGTIPAGTKIHFKFVTKCGSSITNYWMAEFKQGNEWLPAIPTQTVLESATVGLTGAEVNYSATITYNFASTLMQNATSGAYVLVEGTFTTGKDMNLFEFRFRPVGKLTYAPDNKKLVDRSEKGGETRFSSQAPSGPDGKNSGVYDQHVIFEIVE